MACSLLLPGCQGRSGPEEADTRIAAQIAVALEKLVSKHGEGGADLAEIEMDICTAMIRFPSSSSFSSEIELALSNLRSWI
jgi:hypothetical protein